MNTPGVSRFRRLVLRSLSVLLIGSGLYFILNFSRFLGGSFDAIGQGQPLSLALLFVAGTLTGFHCAGMCGALVVGYTVRNAAEGRAHYLTHLYYGAGKTLSYTVIGGLFGALGAIITFTPFMRGVAGVVAGVFLILFGLSTLRIFAPLGRFRLRTPAFIMRWVGGALRQNPHPFVIGLLNGLMIICGPLQAMYIMAAGTGDPVEGSKMLFVFGLGTLPLMMGFGLLASALSRQFAPQLVRASGLVVMVLGIIMLNRGYLMIETGSDPHAGMQHHNPVIAGSMEGSQMIHMMVDQPGLVKEQPRLRVGRPVRWMVGGAGLGGCGDRIVLPSRQLEFRVIPGMNSFEFTPEQPGLLSWQCVAGDVRGSFIIEPTDTPIAQDMGPGGQSQLAERLRELIGKSADLIDALRRQLHP